jgi:hypothetical protein
MKYVENQIRKDLEEGKMGVYALLPYNIDTVRAVEMIRKVTGKKIQTITVCNLLKSLKKTPSYFELYFISRTDEAIIKINRKDGGR